jgi:hypothetical protein
MNLFSEGNRGCAAPPLLETVLTIPHGKTARAAT